MAYCFPARAQCTLSAVGMSISAVYLQGMEEVQGSSTVARNEAEGGIGQHSPRVSPRRHRKRIHMLEVWDSCPSSLALSPTPTVLSSQCAHVDNTYVLTKPHPPIYTLTCPDTYTVTSNIYRTQHTPTHPNTPMYTPPHILTHTPQHQPLTHPDTDTHAHILILTHKLMCMMHTHMDTHRHTHICKLALGRRIGTGGKAPALHAVTLMDHGLIPRTALCLLSIARSNP